MFRRDSQRFLRDQAKAGCDGPVPGSCPSTGFSNNRPPLNVAPLMPLLYLTPCARAASPFDPAQLPGQTSNMSITTRSRSFVHVCLCLMPLRITANS